MRKANQDESVKVINPGTRSEWNSSIELLRIIGRVFNLGTIIVRISPTVFSGNGLDAFIDMMIVALLRKGIFKVTIERHPGEIFDMFLTRLQKIKAYNFYLQADTDL
jgi:hypothetical protein